MAKFREKTISETIQHLEIIEEKDHLKIQIYPSQHFLSRGKLNDIFIHVDLSFGNAHYFHDVVFMTAFSKMLKELYLVSSDCFKVILWNDQILFEYNIVEMSDIDEFFLFMRRGEFSKRKFSIEAVESYIRKTEPVLDQLHILLTNDEVVLDLKSKSNFNISSIVFSYSFEYDSSLVNFPEVAKKIYETFNEPQLNVSYFYEKQSVVKKERVIDGLCVVFLPKEVEEIMIDSSIFLIKYSLSTGKYSINLI